MYAGGVRASHEPSDRLEILLSLTRDLGMNLAGVEIILNCAKRWTPCNASSNVSSNDAGKKWSRITNDHRLVQRAWYYIELFIDPKNENTIYVMSAPALRSTDAGKTWENLSGTHGDFHDLWINPDNPNKFIISNDGGSSITFNVRTGWGSGRALHAEGVKCNSQGQSDQRSRRPWIA